MSDYTGLDEAAATLDEWCRACGEGREALKEAEKDFWQKVAAAKAAVASMREASSRVENAMTALGIAECQAREALWAVEQITGHPCLHLREMVDNA